MSKRRRKSTPAAADVENLLPPVAGHAAASESDPGPALHTPSALSVEVSPVAESRLTVDQSDPPADAAQVTLPSNPVAELLAVAEPSVEPSALANPTAATGPEHPPMVEAPARLGSRLRAVREARGISREDMARRLRVSPNVVSDLESENWSRLGAPVYVRGHLRNYARLLDVPQVAVAHTVGKMIETAPLLPSLPAAAGASWSGRNRHAFTYLVYVLLTLMLAVPTYTMLNNRGINSPEPLVANLARDAAPQIDAAGANRDAATSLTLPKPASALAITDASVASEPASVVATLPAAESSAPMMASMTPVAAPAPTPVAGEGQHLIEILFSGDSWVELLNADGGRLEYGVLGAGKTRQYRVSGPVSLSVGNVSAVTVRVDGEHIDLGAYARQNVARLKLLAPASDNPSAPR